MLKRLIYILLMTLFPVAQLAAQGLSVVDKVCKDAVRTYRVDGEPGLTYHWILTDSIGNDLLLSNPAGTPFTDTDAGGNPIEGSEIEIAWNFDTGIYSLTIEKQSIYSCTSDTVGTIEIVPIPVLNAGPDLVICQGNPLSLINTTGSDYDTASLIWTSSGDGTFDNPNSLNPLYTPGPNDLIAGVVTLTVTADGLGNSGSCTAATSSLKATINPLPKLVLIDPAPLCEPETFDLNDAIDQAASDLNLTFAYFADSAATVPIAYPLLISATGVYYIKATNSTTGCWVTDSVSVVINPKPVLVITDPPKVCEPLTIDLTAATIVTGSDAGLTREYYTDSLATVPIADATAIAVSGTYYIKGINPLTGCFDIQAVNVTINPKPILVITNPDPVCENETVDLTVPEITDGSTIPASSVLTYWKDAAASIAVADKNAVTAGTYYIKAEAPGGCFDIQLVDVTNYPLPVLVITNPDPVCEPNAVDLTDPQIYIGSDASVKFEYYTDSLATTPLANYNAIIVSGTYWVKGIDNNTGCSVVKPVKVNIYPNPVVVINNPPAVCEPLTIDLTAAAITAGSDAGLKFEYYADTTATTPLANYTAIAASGKFFIKGINTTTGCYTIKPVNVTINRVPVLYTNNPQPVCEPETIDLTAPSILAGSFIPASATISYWTNAAATNPVSDPTAIAVSGFYFIKAEAPGGCIDIEPITVVVNPLPKLVVNDPAAVCEPNMIDLTDSLVTKGSDAGLLFEYYIDSLETKILAHADSLKISGIYFIKAINPATGCYVIDRVKVIVNPQPILVITDPDPVCENETVDLTNPDITAGSTIPPLSSFTYWTDPNATIVVPNEKAVYGGTYYIKVEAPGGCFDIKPVVIGKIPLPILATTDPAPVCEPNAIDLSDAAIYIGSEGGLIREYYADSKATLPLANYQTIITSGTYYVKAISPISGCSIVDSVVVTIIPQPLLVITNPPAVCEPNTVNLADTLIIAGSDPGLIYDFFNDTTALSPVVNFTAVTVGGKYFIKATNSLTGCYSIKPVVVIINPQPKLVITNPDPICEPASLDLTDASIITGSTVPPSSVFTYWLNALATNPVPNANTITASGTYFIKITAPGGCYDIQPVDVIVNPQPVLVVTDPPEVCEPMTVNLSDSAIFAGSDLGLKFEYYADNLGTIPVANFAAIDSTGTYYIKAINPATTCFTIEAVHVVVNKLVTPQFSPIGDLCLNSLAPSLPNTSINGIIGTWAPSAINTTTIGKTSYVFTPAPNVCANQLTIEISVIDEINPVFKPYPVLCQDSPPPALPVVSSNGITGTWSPSAISTTTSGTFSFKFTPLAGLCAKDTTILVTVSPQVNPIFDPIGPLCFNSTPPALPTTSVNGITGTWSPATISTATPGLSDYTFTPDNGLCVSGQPLQILVTDPLVLTETHKNVGYTTDPVGSIDLTVTGGFGTHTYLWNTGETTEDLTDIPAGKYTVVVTDDNNCSNSITIDITQIDLMTIAAIGIDSPCPGINGSIQFTFTNVPDGVYDIFYDGGSFPNVTVSGNSATVSAPVGSYKNLYLIVAGFSTINKVDVKIDQTPQMTIAANGVASNCNNSNGDIEFTFTNVPDGTYDIVYDSGIFKDVIVYKNGASVEAIPGTYKNLRLLYSACITNSVDATVYNPITVVPEAETIQPTCDVPFGTITVTYPKVGKGYQYRINGGPYQNSPTFRNLTPDRIYTITAIEVGESCETAEIPVSIYAVPLPPAAPMASVTTPPTCSEPTGSIAVTSPLGNQFTYSIDGGAYQKSTDFTGLTEGQHQLTVQDITTMCRTMAIILVDSIPKSHEAPTASVTVQPSCYVVTGTIVITDPLPGTGFQYSIDGIKFQDSNIFADVLPGTYNVVVRSKVTFCLSDVTILDVLKPVAPELPVVNVIHPNCNISTGSIEVISPLGAKYEYVLDGTRNQKTTIFANLAAGSTHTLKVVDTENGCESGTITININPIPAQLAAPVKTGDPVECEISPLQTLDARNFVQPIPGITIIWYDAAIGGNVVANPILNSIGSVTYYAESFDGSCRSETRTPVTLTINPIPALLVNKGNITECEESPIQVLNANTAITMVAGITPVWYDAPVGGSIVQPTLNTVGSKTFYVESWNVTCKSNGRTPVTLTIIGKPDAPISKGDITVCETIPIQTLNANDAILTKPGQNIMWYDRPTGGNVVANPTLSKTGSVTYYAIDFNGTCASAPRTAVQLTINPLPTKPDVKIAIAPNCVVLTGTAEMILPLGNEFAYSVDSSDYQSSVTFANLIPGLHFARAKNLITGCESDTTIFRVPDVPLKPHITSVTTENCICYGDSGAINFEFTNVSDGTYVIIYLNGQFDNVQVKDSKAKVIAPAGNYNVLAIEANGCTSDENWNVTIAQPEPITVSAKITEIDLKSGQKGEIDITIVGGTGNYTTVWQPNLVNGFSGAASEDIKNLEDGDYTAVITDENNCPLVYVGTIPVANQPPVATNDEFDAKCSSISGDLLHTDNGSGVDSDPDSDLITIDTSPVRLPLHGSLTINSDGTFNYKAYTGYTGDDTFRYRIYDIKLNYSNIATVTIHVVADFDCDAIPDVVDPDADGDGILNVDEGSLTLDSDGDGHPNWLDIDADNDGIVDNIEGQSTADYVPPMDTDTDHDGINDAYDTDHGGTVVVPVDTDEDGTPDFLDTDSDSDGVPDYIEGHDLNADGKIDAGHNISGLDADADGLDDAWDTVDRYEEPIANMTGSNAPIQDFDGDGKNDWRDENDDDDEYLTRFEDLNADGNFANDNTDQDEHPEYLDYGRDCDLFIPNAFSPNGDNIHDYFQIYCIDHFPDAKIYIFDQLGNQLYEKENYGNLQRWGTPEQAWWDGRTRNRNASVTTGGKVVPGTYFYVLKLGNGEVKKSFVFISY